MTTRHDILRATALYAAVTLVWTWPLAARLGHHLPADFGDPLLNSWILAWDATHLGRGWWNANIFYPHPLALAYSEHLLPQALLILPLYAITRNPILCYNVVFLSTFVLSGIGMFLFARELTGNRAAAAVAGLAFAFAPYRAPSLPHVQVLSSAWMPFALYGFRRYFVTGRTRALVDGASAWLAQNLSCGYYLLFFTPVLMAYVAWELVSRRASARTVLAVIAAGTAVAIATVPFVLPYLELRRLGFGPRPFSEIVRFSADVYGYATADPNIHVWGAVMRGWNQAEGAVFPGVTIAALAIIAVGNTALLPLLLVALPLLRIRVPLVQATSVARALVAGAVLSAVVACSSRARRRANAAWLASPAALWTAIVVFAVAMSFGPVVHSLGRTVADGVPYGAFYRLVPGADGLRVPARFATIVMLGLAILTAFAIRTPRAAVVAGTLIVVESFAAPIPIDQNDTTYSQPHLAALPAHVSQADSRELYDFVAGLPNDAAIVELPLGEPAFDVRYMFYSTRHWKPLVNGYSGGAPEEYGQLDQDLQDAPERPDRAWHALVTTGATHAVVHEAFYADGRGGTITSWLRSRGAREVAAFGRDRVFALK